MKNLTTETRRHGGKRGNWIQNAWNRFCDVLSEVFDESAYERFLLRKKLSRSIESYRAFLRERESAMAQKPRCC